MYRHVKKWTNQSRHLRKLRGRNGGQQAGEAEEGQHHPGEKNGEQPHVNQVAPSIYSHM